MKLWVHYAYGARKYGPGLYGKPKKHVRAYYDTASADALRADLMRKRKDLRVIAILDPTMDNNILTESGTPLQLEQELRRDPRFVRAVVIN
jgi:hypothetical protein